MPSRICASHTLISTAINKKKQQMELVQPLSAKSITSYVDLSWGLAALSRNRVTTLSRVFGGTQTSASQPKHGAQLCEACTRKQINPLERVIASPPPTLNTGPSRVGEPHLPSPWSQNSGNGDGCASRGPDAHPPPYFLRENGTPSGLAWPAVGVG